MLREKNEGPFDRSDDATKQRDGAKRPQAAALRYEAPVDRAPRLLAKGERKLAEQILERGRKAGVPIIENEQLVASLLAVAIDDEIPLELYGVVAEVLAWVLRQRSALEERQDR